MSLLSGQQGAWGKTGGGDGASWDVQPDRADSKGEPSEAWGKNSDAGPGDGSRPPLPAIAPPPVPPKPQLHETPLSPTFKAPAAPGSAPLTMDEERKRAEVRRAREARARARGEAGDFGVRLSDPVKVTEYMIFTHHVYTLRSKLSIRGVPRRYSEFSRLREEITKSLPGVPLLPLPKKDWALFPARRSASFIEERRKGLERFLTELCEIPFLSKTDLVRDFLTLTQPQLAKRQSARRGESKAARLAEYVDRLKQYVDKLDRGGDTKETVVNMEASANHARDSEDLLVRVIESARPLIRGERRLLRGEVPRILNRIRELNRLHNAEYFDVKGDFTLGPIIDLARQWVQSVAESGLEPIAKSIEEELASTRSLLSAVANRDRTERAMNKTLSLVDKNTAKVASETSARSAPNDAESRELEQQVLHYEQLLGLLKAVFFRDYLPRYWQMKQEAFDGAVLDTARRLVRVCKRKFAIFSQIQQTAMAGYRGSSLFDMPRGRCSTQVGETAKFLFSEDETFNWMEAGDYTRVVGASGQPVAPTEAKLDVEIDASKPAVVPVPDAAVPISDVPQ